MYMKLLISLSLVLALCTQPVFAQEEASVMGLYDEDITSSDSASISAAPTPTASPSARATTYLDPTNAPVSGTFETSLMILLAGISFVILGIRFSR